MLSWISKCRSAEPPPTPLPESPYSSRIYFLSRNPQIISKRTIGKIYIEEGKGLMKKLLIVGNIQDFMAEGKNILTRTEFEISTAASAEEALDIQKTERADLIIADLDLPGMSGDRLCSRIREDEELKGVSIIIVCTSAASDIARVCRCKANSFITKPIHHRELIDKVTQLADVPERKSSRVLLKVSVNGRSARGPFICSSRDISTAGILLQSDRTLAIGDVISCNFLLPDSSRIFADLEIIRVTRADDNTFLYGARYVDLSPEHKFAIKVFINKRSTGTDYGHPAAFR